MSGAHRSRPRAIALIGPTAAGKSALALQLATSFGGEIVSLDSAQVYRGMDIGTAKPSAAEQAAVPHHLIDLIAPTESTSAALWRAAALAAIAAIHARGRVPIVAGGTMLYFKALREGLDDLPQADPTVRAAIEERAAAQGWPALHAELSQSDPATAARLARTDAQRIGRALEVLAITGSPLSALLRGAARSQPLPFELCSIALDAADRAALHLRIAERFDAMLTAGLVDEVRTLRRTYPDLTGTMPSMRCVGYRQVWDMLEGRSDPKDLRERGIAATRQLAKRQCTWLRSLPDLVRVDCADRGLATQVNTIAGRFLAA
ncbi:MAG: tRNA (adenosine(37)-N6)-dimethylallyltransferase MiaA [Burkholderiales bacterium]|nr:tRNA (adenosine(37)-N6)-dimethylallyltransferase MiaA [Burkholderiales bacterium]